MGPERPPNSGAPAVARDATGRPDGLSQHISRCPGCEGRCVTSPLAAKACSASSPGRTSHGSSDCDSGRRAVHAPPRSRRTPRSNRFRRAGGGHPSGRNPGPPQGMRHGWKRPSPAPATPAPLCAHRRYSAYSSRARASTCSRSMPAGPPGARCWERAGPGGARARGAAGGRHRGQAGQRRGTGRRELGDGGGQAGKGGGQAGGRRRGGGRRRAARRSTLRTGG